MEFQEGEKDGRELTQLLEAAADGRHGAIEAFFECLLRSEVFVPVSPQKESSGSIPELGIVGEGTGKHNFLTVDYDGKECVLVFSEEHFVQEWADREQDFVKKEFKTLLWMIGNDTWLYLNASQEIGKELTAWEVELLRRGPEAIGELAAALNEEPIGEIEVRSTGEMYPELLGKLRPIVELYPELEEAFLVAVKEGGSEHEKPMIGLRWNGGNDGKRSYVRTEIEETGKEYLPHGVESVFVVDDLDNPDSPNHSLFSDATPFHFRKALPKSGRSWKDKLLGVFREKP